MQPLKMFFYYLIEVMPWYRFPNYFCQLPPTSYLAVSSGQIGTHTHAHACAHVHTHTHTHTHRGSYRIPVCISACAWVSGKHQLSPSFLPE